MSECVVRMEMPKDCFECPFGIIDDTEDGVWCNALAQQSSGQREDCPIVCALPEGHGRLVDEKEVKDWVENWLCVNKYYHPYSSSKSIPVSELYDVFQRMDAAVPAERSET